MKVAFDGRTIADRYPGVGRYAFGLARALAAYTEVTVISNPAEENSRHDLSQISAHLLPLLARPGSLDQHRFIPAAVGATDASVYHAPYFLLYPSPTFMPLPCPGVVTFYDLIPLSSAAGFSFMGRWMIRFSHRQAGEDAAQIIVLSRAARDSFVAKLSLDSRKIVIIPPGIDSHFRPRLRNEVKALRARIGLPDRYLLYVGTNRPHKNLPRLMEAFARLPAETPPLIVAGAEDRRYPQARRAVEAFGLADRVRFLGAVAEADLPALYSGATLFVFPSLVEGFGLPVVEAMACGTPVACSNAPGLEEAGGAAAVRFDPTNSASVAETLSRILEDAGERDEMRRRGIEHAASFSWERAAEATLRVYEAVA